MTPDHSSPGPPPAVLLDRPSFAGDLAQATGFARGRRVLVTGAAGSDGRPLTNALAPAEPASLVALDHHEYSLFSLERALADAGGGLAYELADIRDRARMEGIFAQYRPEIVFHLAAAKHVPYGERFPEAAVGANVVATQALLDLARAGDVEVFVYPSSDKSVQPPSVYGATKRVAEALVQAAAAERRWSVVRYVNIIGTRGSVVETFTQQILDARPLGVTDQRMTRYWISMDEALWCLLAAARCAAPASVVMPACGEPLPIVETARRLAGWYRPEVDPYPIVFTGIRPGERLGEILLSPNEFFADGPFSGLRTVRTTRDRRALDGLPELLERLHVQAASGARDALAASVRAAADALQ